MSVDREWFSRSLTEYERAAEDSDFPLDRTQLYPCDDRNAAPAYDSHYTQMDLHFATLVIGEAVDRGTLQYEQGPGARGFRHVDVGSRVDGFVTSLLASGLHVTHVDIRRPSLQWVDFEFREDDARTLSTFADCSVSSLSSLHCAEHVGIPRYSSEIDAYGMEKAMASLARVLEPGGHLYFAVPIGRHRVAFNAHRISSPGWLRARFEDLGLTLESFAAVDDAGRFHAEAKPSDYGSASYSCGCFELSKRGSQ